MLYNKFIVLYLLLQLQIQKGTLVFSRLQFQKFFHKFDKNI